MDTRPINLAASRMAERQFCKRLLVQRFRILAGLLFADLIFLAIGGLFTDSVASRHRELDNRLLSAQKQSLLVRTQLADLKERQKLSVWGDKLTAESLTWLDALEQIAMRMPQDSWLSRIETVPKDQALQIEGGAADMGTVAALAVQLTTGGGFKDLKLGSSESLTVNGHQAVRFSLSLKLAGRSLNTQVLSDNHSPSRIGVART